MVNIRKFLIGLGLLPNPAGHTADTKGELEVITADSRLFYHDGTSAQPVLTDTNVATITNKTINGSSNTITNIPSSAISGVITIPNGGTGQSTAAAAITALSGTQVAGEYLRSDGTNTLLSPLLGPDVTGLVAPANLNLDRTFNNQSGTSYTFTLADSSAAGGNVLVTGNNSSPQTYTLPAHASVAFPVGSCIDVLQLGSGVITISPAGGVTLNSNGSIFTTLAQYLEASLVQVSLDNWVLVQHPSSATANSVVLASGDGNESISLPSQIINQNGTASFTVTPSANYTVSPVVGGTAPPGSFVGNVYTTGPITTNSSVFFNSRTAASYLVVAGGGGGSSSNNLSSGGGNGGGAGGGAGGLLSGSTQFGVGSYPIIVGSGGTGALNNTGSSGFSGNNSSVNGIIALGGGGGGDGGSQSNPNTGGSGGGGAGSYTGQSGTGAGQLGALGTIGQGNAGGTGHYNFPSALYAGGGGGGAGAVGSDGSSDSNTGGNGGNGLSNSITGVSVTYAAGGGGAGTNTGGNGGTGGGGAGSTFANATSGTANTGSGGGGAGQSFNAGNGGSGIVVLSYPASLMTATGGTITTSGGNRIHTFTSNGTFQVVSLP